MKVINLSAKPTCQTLIEQGVTATPSHEETLAALWNINEVPTLDSLVDRAHSLMAVAGKIVRELDTEEDDGVFAILETGSVLTPYAIDVLDDHAITTALPHYITCKADGVKKLDCFVIYPLETPSEIKEQFPGNLA